jgi:hypothetical protein
MGTIEKHVLGFVEGQIGMTCAVARYQQVIASASALVQLCANVLRVSSAACFTDTLG